KQQIAAAVTYAGNLPIEAVREEYRAALPRLIQSAVSDRIEELRGLSRQIVPVQAGTFAIANTTLIDGTGAGPVSNANVIVRDGRMGGVGRARIPANIPIIDGHGRTLLPGLWEMHAHFAQVEYGPAYLAAGVTTARDCGEEFEFITAARDAIASGALGPRLILA